MFILKSKIVSRNQILLIVLITVLLPVIFTEFNIVPQTTRAIEMSTVTQTFDLSKVRIPDSLKDEAYSEIFDNLERIRDAVYPGDYWTTDENGDRIYIEPTTDQVKIDYENAFVMYGINSENIIIDYNKNENFAEIISEDFSLNFPVLSSDDILISLVALFRIRTVDELIFPDGASEEYKQEMIDYATKYGGHYKLAMIGQYMSMEAAEIFSDDTKLNSLLSSIEIDGIENIKLVTTPGFGYLEMLYFSTSEQKEYAIPYSKCADYLSIENGKLYTMQELFIAFSQVKILEVMPVDEYDSVIVFLNRPPQNGGTLIIAFYNGNKLLSMKTGTITGDFAIVPIPTPETADTIKVMLWHDLFTMRPLCPAKKMIKDGGGEWVPTD